HSRTPRGRRRQDRSAGPCMRPFQKVSVRGSTAAGAGKRGKSIVTIRGASSNIGCFRAIHVALESFRRYTKEAVFSLQTPHSRGLRGATRPERAQRITESSHDDV